MTHFVEVHIPGNSPQRHELIGERVTLGSGAGAAIRVPESAGFNTDPVEIFVADAGVQVQVPNGRRGQLVFEGAEQRIAHVPWAGEVFVGKVRLTFLRDSTVKRPSPVLLLLAQVFVIVLGLGAYHAAVPDDASNHDVPAPTLFDEYSNSVCPQSDQTSAEHRARQDERAALAKQERSAFHTTDGVDAVLLFRQAQACFTLAGKVEDASRAANALTRWSGRLNEQYATLRLRLRVALDNQRPTDALAAVRELQALLAHQEEGRYRQWLTQLARSLEQKVAPG